MSEFANIPADWLAACRRNFGSPPRRFHFWHRWRWLYAPQPNWLLADDSLTQVWTHFVRIFEHGELQWGANLQANTLLYQPGPFPHPVEVIYPQAPGVVGDPEYLRSVARSVFQLKKSQQTSPLLQELADYLTRETVRVFAITIPSQFTPQAPCYISTTVVFRHHLPNRMLSRHMFPLVVLRGNPHMALILPYRFWPSEMVRWWEA